MKTSLTDQQREALVDLACDAPTSQKAAAAWFLAQGKAAAPILADALENKALGSIGHLHILRLLAQIRAPDSFPSIYAALKRAMATNDHILLSGAMSALAMFGGEQAVFALKPLLSGPDSEVVHRAAVLLGQTRVGSAREALVTLLQSADPLVRHGAATGLLEHGSAEALDALVFHLETEDDSEVKKVIESGLEGRR